jgi:hypothetical protein
LERRLHRFYIYLYADAPFLDAAPIEEMFLSEFYGYCLRADPIFAQSIAVMAARTGKHILLRPAHHQWREFDRLVVAELRLNTSEPLLDYSNYLLCCVKAISHDQLTETNRFSQREMARARLYQIGMILAHVLGNICLSSPMGLPTIERYLMTYKAGADFYFTPSKVEPPTPEDVGAYDALKGYLTTLYTKVCGYAGPKRLVRVKPFHGHGELELVVPVALHEQFTDQIRSSYKTFWNGY